jgi:manganese/zinc/iron transport system substrate-binding protein
MTSAWRMGVGLFLVCLAGCAADGNGSADLANRKVRAVTTTGMITDLVQRVGGDRLEVTGLMGPGVDPHLFKASEGDTLRLARADVVFYNGLHLEGKMAEVLEQMGRRVKTVAVTSKLDPKEVRPAPSGADGLYDPHVWFDVTLWMKATEAVRDTLAELDPTSADVYRANAAAYLKELADLHDYVKAQADKVPATRRVVVTAHDAFFYFGQRYGFEVRGLQGINTAAEASTADVQELAEFIAKRRIPAVFVESSVSPKTIEAVQAAVRAKGFEVRLGGSLYSDALGSPGTPEGTYVGMVRHNIDTIVRALAE